ncbi:Epidermal growth factor receptor substrate 15-like 1 [Plecturocebus cupreus]
MRFDEIFLKTDLDLDGYVSGQEVKEIFMHSGLTQNLLAHIWLPLCLASFILPGLTEAEQSACAKAQSLRSVPSSQAICLHSWALFILAMMLVLAGGLALATAAFGKCGQQGRGASSRVA